MCSSVLILTQVICNNTEWFEIRFPHILGKGVSVLLKMMQQFSTASIRLMNLLPLKSINWVQDGTACSDHVLKFP